MDGKKQGGIPAREITNKIVRSQMVRKEKHQKAVARRKEREKRKKERERLGDAAPPKMVPVTIESTREHDETTVQQDDEEVLRAQDMDEFQSYFEGEKAPKIMMTTSLRPSKVAHEFVEALVRVFPNSEYYPRRGYEVKSIVEYATNADFTDLIIVGESSKKKLRDMWVVHLPEGPTAHFRLSNPRMPETIHNHGRTTDHHPEVILNNFTTRLGHSIGRLFASLVPQQPQFEGRRVVTFHNQRDFIFFRHHRYIIDDENTARLQELGPRFTLRLWSLQKGTFDTKFGEYEWKHATEMDTSRRRFFL